MDSLVRDECGEAVILGRAGQIFQYGVGQFGVLLMFDSSRRWKAAKQKLLVAGT